ncbi:MAG: hypothetical protein K0Q91_2079 [Fibrobacteria bacterium]|jgi:hypothetical protein|nr:hypothetical protein [Fibrobacteria bacterium]
MKNILNSIPVAAAVFAALLSPAETRAGTFYGLWWDGSSEQFVSVNPYTSGMTVLKQIPGVKYTSPGVLLDPDSSRYGFVGMEDGPQKYYYAIHAPTGDLVAKLPKNDTINGMIYSPNDRKIYGLSWTDTGAVTLDSLGNPRPPSSFAGKEFFEAIDPFTSARTSTHLPKVVGYQANSSFLDTDSGRYGFTARERNGYNYHYVVNTATGEIVARAQAKFKLDNPVYNAALGAVHGLVWMNDSIPGDSVTVIRTRNTWIYDTIPSGDTLMIVRRKDSTIAVDTVRVPGPPTAVGTEYFVTVGRDSVVSKVAIPGVKYIATFISAFDSDSGRYVFVGGSTGSDMKYYVVDAATGTVLSQTLRTHNVNNLAYAPDHSTFDASYAPTRVAAPAVQTRLTKVNSFEGFITLEAAGSEGEILSFSILDVSGKTLLGRDGIRDGRARIETRGLKNGIHLYQIRSGSSVLGQGKVLIR